MTASTMSDPSALGLDEALARQGEAHTRVDVDEPARQLVLFRLGGQRFALPGSAVREILDGQQSVYFVPGLPDDIEGVIHLRGAIESVITLERLLDLPAPPAGAGMLLLVDAAGIRTGVRIEALEDVCEVSESALKPPEALNDTLAPFVTALLHRDAREAIALLDADALLTAFQAGQG